MEREEMRRNVRKAISGFEPRSGNKELAGIILKAVAVEGSTVYFFTGGDDSEPEGAVISIPGVVGHCEISEATKLVDWSNIEFRSYQRYSDDSFASTETFSLNASGEVIS